MKKNIFKTLCILLLACLFPSCSQNSNEEESFITANSQYKIDKVLTTKIESDQRIEYSLLSKEEKFALWFQKYESLINDDMFLNTESIILNDEQKQLVEELKNKLSQNIFDEVDNDEKEYFQNIYVPDFLKRAQKVFTYDEIGLIFYKLSTPNADTSLKQLALSTDANSEKDCNCNIGAFFTCQWGQNLCEESRCASSLTGCGFTWNYPCDGDCKAI